MDSGLPKNLWARTQKRHAPPRQKETDSQFGALRASLLFCQKCCQATPARERLLLVLPTGNLYEYLCAHCGTSTGSKTDNQQQNAQVIIP
ncbi:MAG: cytoplasmic protein [Nitrospiraceae bacterium]|nr:cytoplasmic protein [Nitrospiraceae bacterium]